MGMVIGNMGRLELCEVTERRKEMIRINNIKVPLDFDFAQLKDFCSKKCGIPYGQIKTIRLSKRSVAADKSIFSDSSTNGHTQ